MPAILQSALHPAGVQAGHIEWLWWIMLWACTAIFIAVVAALYLAVRRGRSADLSRPSEDSMRTGVILATTISLVILFGLLVASTVTSRAIGSLTDTDAVAIQLTGYQWWWHAEYVQPQPSLQITTANELHIPVGRPVVLTLRSADVIHSFWVPRLHGKIDLIPGRANTIWLRADSAGIFRGQCAEYCGVQHAHMALVVVAEPPDRFDAWLNGQRQAASPPATPEQARGQEIVERGSCALCHTIRGTVAGGRTAPDLTHFASRSTIGAGAVPNTRDQLAGWIADPQHVKPGNKMPATGLSTGDLQSALAYLETLR